MIFSQIALFTTAVVTIIGGWIIWRDWRGAATSLRRQHAEATSTGVLRIFRKNPPNSERAAGFVTMIVGVGLLVLGIVVDSH